MSKPLKANSGQRSKGQARKLAMVTSDTGVRGVNKFFLGESISALIVLLSRLHVNLTILIWLSRRKDGAR